MGVDETRQHRFAMQVHRLCVPAAHAAHLVVVAHGQDTPAASVDSHGLCPWLHGIHGVDRSIQIEYDTHRLQCLDIR